MISVAMDVQGAARARPYVEKAGATFTALVDEENILGQLFGFKAVPNGLLIDENGILRYHKFGRFDIRQPEYAQIVETWTTTPSTEELRLPLVEDPIGGPEHRKAIQHLQWGTALYRQGKVQEALAEWRKGPRPRA